MGRHAIGRVLSGALLAAVLAGAATACSNGTKNPSAGVSKAASAASSLASAAASAVASATAEAGRKLDEFKRGTNAKGDVKLGAVAKDGDGRATVKVTVTNGTDSTKSYAVQINFRGQGGNLLDTVVLTLDDVAPSSSKDATARSHRALSGDVIATVGTALRH